MRRRPFLGGGDFTRERFRGGVKKKDVEVATKEKGEQEKLVLSKIPLRS